jgi:ATP-dependent Lon protease
MFNDELRKLQEPEPAVSEANATRNYLDWLTQVRPSLFLQCNIRYMNFTDTLESSHPRTAPFYTLKPR